MSGLLIAIGVSACLVGLVEGPVAAGQSPLTLQRREIANHTRSVWDAYHWYILAGLGILIVQSVMIAALLLLRSRRRELEARNAALLSAVPDMMFVLTRDGEFVDFHAPEGTDLYAKPSLFLGKRMRDILPGEIATLFEDQFRQLTPGQPPAVVEYSLPMPEGQRQYEARIVPLKDRHVLAIVRDMTEGLRAQTALHEARQELARSSRLSALGEFAASMAHEIRQPLTAIMMNAKSCLRGVSRDNPDLAEMTAALLDIVEATQRAEDVIQHNRRLFRDHVVERTPLDINAIVRESLTFMAPRLRESGVTVDATLASDLPAVSGDRIELQQVLVNLLSNSVDALETVQPAARHIELSSCVRTADHTVVLSVADNGAGFRGVESPRLFALSYTTKPAGTGIGLAISRSIVEAHGGHLWAEENPAGGAIFRFSLPADSVSVRREASASRQANA